LRATGLEPLDEMLAADYRLILILKFILTFLANESQVLFRKFVSQFDPAVTVDRCHLRDVDLFYIESISAAFRAGEAEFHRLFGFVILVFHDLVLLSVLDLFPDTATIRGVAS